MLAKNWRPPLLRNAKKTILLTICTIGPTPSTLIVLRNLRSPPVFGRLKYLSKYFFVLELKVFSNLFKEFTPQKIAFAAKISNWEFDDGNLHDRMSMTKSLWTWLQNFTPTNIHYWTWPKIKYSSIFNINSVMFNG